MKALDAFHEGDYVSGYRGPGQWVNAGPPDP